MTGVQTCALPISDLISKNDYEWAVKFTEETMMFYDSIEAVADVDIRLKRLFDARVRKFDYLVAQNNYDWAIKFADDMKKFYKKISSWHSKELWHKKWLWREIRNLII